MSLTLLNFVLLGSIGSGALNTRNVDISPLDLALIHIPLYLITRVSFPQLNKGGLYADLALLISATMAGLAASVLTCLLRPRVCVCRLEKAVSPQPLLVRRVKITWRTRPVSHGPDDVCQQTFVQKLCNDRQRGRSSFVSGYKCLSFVKASILRV